MKWYSAHVVLYVKSKRGPQLTYPVWENVYLISARSAGAALKKARAFARLDEGDSNGSFIWNGRPATWVFAGIRKLVSVAHVASSKPLASGDELTYSEFTVATRKQLRALASGRPVRVSYEE